MEYISKVVEHFKNPRRLVALVLLIVVVVHDLIAKYKKAEPKKWNPNVVYTMKQGKDPLPDDKPVLVEVFATWCGPCKQAVPHMNEMYREHGDKVSFIGMVAGDEKDVDAFIAEHKPEYPIAILDGTNSRLLMSALGIDSYPKCTLLDKERNCAWQGHPKDLSSVLETQDAK